MVNDTAFRFSMPMFGGAISALAALFRLTGHVRTKAGVCEGTARRALSDQPDVASEKLTLLLKGLVDGLFTQRYLSDRGFADSDATKHNAALVVAVERAGRDFEKFAILATQTTLSRSTGALLLAAPLHAIAVRLAAYLTLFGRHHPAFDAVGTWLAADGLAAWYASVVRRVGVNQISMTRLANDLGVATTTVKRIKDGKSVPHAATIVVLAETLVDHELVDARVGRALTEAEIVFELRLACAVADVRSVMKDPALGILVTSMIEAFRSLRSLLRGRSRDEVQDLLARGTEAECWVELEDELREDVSQRMVAHATAEYERLMRLAKRDSRVAAQRVGRNLADQASLLRRQVPPELDGSPAFATWMQDLSNLFFSVAADHPSPLPRHRPEQLEAEALVMKAIAPWETHSAEAKEHLLRRAIELCPDSILARTQFATLLRSLHREEEAIVCLREAVLACPSSWHLRNDLALLLGWNLRHTEALNVIDAPGPTEPMPLLVRATRGFCLVRIRRLEEGEALLREVLEAQPENSLALHGIAACHDARGETKKAREFERKAEFLTRGASGS